LVISEHHKYIFIAVPRTGSNSVSKFLLAHDPTAESNVIRIGERKVPVSHHVTAAKLKSLLGHRYDEYLTFGFVREPRARFLSVYSYYRHGDAARIVGGRARAWMDHGGRRVRVARLLPFWLWSVVYPYRACSAFLTDGQERLLVNRIGHVESLQADLGEIIREIGLGAPEDVPWLNAAEHLDSYPAGRALERWFAFKFRRDRRFYGAE
jgi:hypothetical protein